MIDCSLRGQNSHLMEASIHTLTLTLTATSHQPSAAAQPSSGSSNAGCSSFGVPMGARATVMAQLGVKSDAPLLCGSGIAVSWRRAVAAAAAAAAAMVAVAAVPWRRRQRY